LRAGFFLTAIDQLPPCLPVHSCPPPPPPKKLFIPFPLVSLLSSALLFFFCSATHGGFKVFLGSAFVPPRPVTFPVLSNLSLHQPPKARPLCRCQLPVWPSIPPSKFSQTTRLSLLRDTIIFHVPHPFLSTSSGGHVCFIPTFRPLQPGWRLLKNSSPRGSSAEGYPLVVGHRLLLLISSPWSLTRMFNQIV